MEDNVQAPPRPEVPEPGPSTTVHKEPSEADIPLHIHAAKHHDPHKLNYAAAAREEMHEIATSPHSVKLVGKRTGVEEWDRMNEKLPSEVPGHVTHDAKVMVESFGVKK
ncbi:hypothetical protein N2152v2_002976 [Parachlorella kessleri]